MKRLILLLIGVCFLGSCRTVRTVEVPVELEKVVIKTDTVFKTNNTIKFDSIYTKDTCWLTVAADGTKVLNNLKLKKEFHNNSKVDTVYKSKVRIDSIPYPVTITKTVIEKQEYKGFFYYLWLIGFIVAIIIALFIYFKDKVENFFNIFK